jgi:putative membrane protein
MTEDKSTGEDHILNSNDLAFERTVLAENRTLMAWIRTAISLISFGFTIYKFFEETLKTTPTAAERIMTPRIAGMILIAFGLLSLIWGLAEYNAGFKKLKHSYPATEKSKTSLLSVLILLLGLVLFLAAMFRQ